jgi:hypothetical protein
VPDPLDPELLAQVMAKVQAWEQAEADAIHPPSTAMTGAERVRRYRARQRGLIEGNERLRPGPKPNRARNIRKLIEELDRQIAFASAADIAGLAAGGWIMNQRTAVAEPRNMWYVPIAVVDDMNDAVVP